jgi:hypothetical protein
LSTSSYIPISKVMGTPSTSPQIEAHQARISRRRRPIAKHGPRPPPTVSYKPKAGSLKAVLDEVAAELGVVGVVDHSGPPPEEEAPPIAPAE